MKYTYIYRDASGAKHAGKVEAKNRAECFAKLKAQGIVPVQVREGGSGQNARRPEASGRTPVMRFLVGLGILAVLGVLAYLVYLEFSGGREALPPPPKSEKSARQSAPRLEKPRVATPTPRGAKPAPAAPTVSAALPVPEAPPRTPWTNIYTNGRGEEVRVGRDGKRVAMLSAWQRKREEEAKNPPKRVFRHTAEAYMAMFLNPAEAVPPPPENYTDEQVAQMLVEKIEIDPENDTPDEIRQKEGVQKLKEELKEWIKGGGTFDGYLNELQKRQNLEAAKLLEARKMISEAMENGNVDEARERYDAIN